MKINEISNSGSTTAASTPKATQKEETTAIKVAGETKADKTKGVEVQRTIQKEDIDGKLSDKERALLVRYGFDDQQIGNFEWVGITGARIHTNPKTGQKELWLTSKENQDYPAGTYRLELPIDENYEPSKINAYRAEDEYNVHFENVKGNLVFLQAAQGSHKTPKLAFEGNSNVHIQGLDGASDSVKLEYPATATFNTGDYADSVVGVSKKGNYSEYNLKPGNHVFKNQAVNK